MIERWEILKPQGNTHKYRLLLKCELKDIVGIVKELGSVCSRPERIISNEYNFVISFLTYNTEIEEKVKGLLIRLTANTLKTTSPQNAKEPQDFEIPMPSLEIKEKVEIEKGKVKVVEKEEKTQLEDKKQAVREEIKEKPINPGPVIPKSKSVRIKKEDIDIVNKENKRKSDEKITEVRQSENKSFNKVKLKWSIELPLNPILSFQTLITSTHNRFAHAAAMAVVENPGVMYNPILIYGPIGSGKSHLIHSMSYGLSSTIGQKNIFVTNGVKFSLGVNLAIKEGFIDQLENIINEAKVIIIDDVHLMLVDKGNKQFISRIINNSMKSNKQVAFSSIFSPQELEPLESMLGIEFSQGWMVAIKPPDSHTYRIILNQLLNNMDIKLSEEDIIRFFVNKSMNFRNVNKFLFRMKKLEKYLSSFTTPPLHQDMLGMLIGEKDDLTAPAEEEIKGANFYKRDDENSFYRWGVFYPKGMKDYVAYVLNKLIEIASNKLSIDFVFKSSFIEEYDPDEVYGVPFKIGNFVIDKNINGAIIIGPPPTSALSAKEVEFSHITEKILESMNIKTGWIYSSKLKAESIYLCALLDLL